MTVYSEAAIPQKVVVPENVAVIVALAFEGAIKEKSHGAPVVVASLFPNDGEFGEAV